MLQIRIKRAIKTTYHQFPKSPSSFDCANSLLLTGQWNLAQNYEFQVFCSLSCGHSGPCQLYLNLCTTAIGEVWVLQARRPARNLSWESQLFSAVGSLLAGTLQCKASISPGGRYDRRTILQLPMGIRAEGAQSLGSGRYSVSKIFYGHCSKNQAMIFPSPFFMA